MTRLTLIPLVAIALSSPRVLAGPELTKAYILSIVKDAKPDIDTCGASLTAETTVKTHFTIDPSGEVVDVKVSGKHAKDQVGACLKQKLAALRFGPSLKAMPVGFPFKLGGAASGAGSSAADDDGATHEKMSTETATAPPTKKEAAKAANKEVAELLKQLQTMMSVCGTGTVSAKFNILETGLVRNVMIDGAHADDQVGQCVSTKLTRARFPASKTVTPVQHTFRLE